MADSSSPDVYDSRRRVDVTLASIARFFIRQRRFGVALQIVIAALCFWSLNGFRLRDDPNAWPPPNDPFVRLNRDIMALFGGGNSVSIELVANEGTIYNPENLSTIKEITDSLYLIPGCIPFAVRSLSTLSSERYEIQNKGTPDETFLISPIMPQFPRSVAAAQEIERAVRDNPLLNGVLASKDGKAALILADFRSEVPPHARIRVETTEPVAIYSAVAKVIQRYQRPGLTLRAAGTPIIIGWVNSIGLWYIGGAFVCFLLTIASILWYAFRSFSGVILPLRVAFLGVLMGFGLYRLFFGAILYSASALLAPFIIVAAGACHSVQFLTRFFHEEYPRLRNVEAAIVNTFVSRLRPMLVSLLCDIIPFAVMAVIPFENVRMLGIVTALGLSSLTIDEFALMIPALSSVTLRELERVARQQTPTRRGERLDRILASLIRRTIESRQLTIGVVVGSLLLAVASAWIIRSSSFGQNNTYAIHNYLTKSWRHSDLYLMEREIVGRFRGVYPMTVLISPEPGNEKVLEGPAVIRGVDVLADYLRLQRDVGNVADVALPVKLDNQFVHDGDEMYFRVPQSRGALGEMLLDMADRAPGVYSWLFTNDVDYTVIIGYVDSTAPEVVHRIIEATKSRATQLFRHLPVRVGVSGGSVGIAAAFNENIKYWLWIGGGLGFLGTFLLALLFVRSWVLSFLLVVPLVIGTALALAIMRLVGIELNSNTIGALAIASGVGIDSEVYLLFRVREEYMVLQDFREALVQGYVKIRRALLVSNGSLILGCWALIPVPLYIGYVGFGMGLVLLLCFVMSAILSPILWSWFGRSVVVSGSQEKGSRKGAEKAVGELRA
jgi:uncharacterized protein